MTAVYRRRAFGTDGTSGTGKLYKCMRDNEPVDPVGNEPSPLLFFGAALIPLLGVAGWALGLFG